MKSLTSLLLSFFLSTALCAQNNQPAPIYSWGTGLDGSTYQKTAIYSDVNNGLLIEAPLNSSSVKLPIQINWRGGGTPPIHVNSSGLVGIGTSSPSYNLDVSGNLRASSFINASEYITVQNGSSYRVALNGQSDGYITGRDASNVDKFLIAANGNSYLNGGNVGIGTPTPYWKLHVNGAITAEGDGAGNYADINLKNGNQRWHISGPRYGDGNRLGIFWHDGSIYHDYFTLSTSGNIGIGTSDPAFKLDVEGNLRTTSFINANEYITVQNGSSYRVAINGQSDGYVTGRDASNLDKFLISANGNSYLNGGNVGIGTTSPDAKLAVNGTIHAKEIKVDLNVPGADYVFEPNYKLLSLEEIKAYIDQHKHLPEVPSAKEMETNGVNVSDMNMLLLKKIEELTLYVIEQNKNNELQKEINKMLLSEIESLKRKNK